MVLGGHVRKSRNFIQYTTERAQKHKDLEKLKAYLPHVRRAQGVDRTWNFSLSTIDSALQTLNQDSK